MKITFFLKKIENLIIKKSFNYPKTIIEYYNNIKKLQFYLFQVLVAEENMFNKMNSFI